MYVLVNCENENFIANL